MSYISLLYTEHQNQMAMTKRSRYRTRFPLYPLLFLYSHFLYGLTSAEKDVDPQSFIVYNNLYVSVVVRVSARREDWEIVGSKPVGTKQCL